MHCLVEELSEIVIGLVHGTFGCQAWRFEEHREKPTPLVAVFLVAKTAVVRAKHTDGFDPTDFFAYGNASAAFFAAGVFVGVEDQDEIKHDDARRFAPKKELSEQYVAQHS